jgi:prepilin-type N-terminal cleavage/methylation domain-containing protein
MLTVQQREPRQGFTLIELLVVIAIIALLVAILIPALGQAREMARRLPCAANEKNMGSAVQMYATSNSEFIPPLKAQVNSSGLCWWWQDWIQPYFDLDAIRSTTTNGWGESIGCQPADGNYSVRMPTYRYSRRMDCPAQKSIGESKFAYSGAINPTGNYNTDYYLEWLYNFADPASNSDSSVSPLPSYHEIGSGWTKTAKIPRRMGYFRNAAGLSIIIEPNYGSWGFCFPGNSYQRVWIAGAAPHMGTCDTVMIDGHVEQLTQSFLVSWSAGLPFYGK